MKIGLIRENKIPIDKRVAFSPDQLTTIHEDSDRYFDFVVEPSPHRCYEDEEYVDEGIEVSADLDDCDVLMGIKEVPVANLLSDKTYFFFSHTIKKQPSNRKLLQAILEKNITMIDYEVLKDDKCNRVVAFGRWAGIVGAYNGIWTYGQKTGRFSLKRAHECFDLKELKKELQKVKLPAVKLLVTGTGKVAKGAIEVLEWLKIKKVEPVAFLEKEYGEAVFTQVGSADYNKRKDDGMFNREEFHKQPELYESNFLRFTKVADIFMAAAYWDHKAPRLFEKKDTASPDFKIKVIADITCDIDGSVPTTVKSSTVADPVFDFDPQTQDTCEAFSGENHISVMAIDNLPCELPRDASHDFGNQLMKHVIPELLLEKSEMLDRATIAKGGKLTTNFTYLEDYVNQQI
ncbi:alanine dehydrogenase [Litoribacter ruber]|uniref:NAD(P)-dependent oxidoreductase n=1 Tax=Litoribacter ruber TaxID=702568 RepID=UPI001BD9B8E4|nr:NAD(P)-dependent oxidoreductase [Litoribacter ruber]MBT0809797.1 alanine dehydrogenase [Litoribacter ruber]